MKEESEPEGKIRLHKQSIQQFLRAAKQQPNPPYRSTELTTKSWGEKGCKKLAKKKDFTR